MGGRLFSMWRCCCSDTPPPGDVFLDEDGNPFLDEAGDEFESE